MAFRQETLTIEENKRFKVLLKELLVKSFIVFVTFKENFISLHSEPRWLFNNVGITRKHQRKKIF